MTRVKICGLARPEDAAAAVAAGADFLGLVFAPSPRQVDLAAARRIREAVRGGPPRVGVFVSPEPDDVEAAVEAGGLDYVQIHGSLGRAALERIAARAGRPLIRALAAGRDDTRAALDLHPYALLLDAPPEGEASPGDGTGGDTTPPPAGGRGRPFDWQLAREPAARARVFLAGGLTPANVGEAVFGVRPFAVDVSSGVEAEAGRKDPALIRAFVEAVRAADRELAAGKAAP